MKTCIAIVLLSVSALIESCSKSKSPGTDLNDPILGTWKEKRVTTLSVDSTQSPVVSTYTDTTFTSGYGIIFTFKPNHIVSMIDSVDLLFVDKGNYSDANGQLVVTFVYDNRLFGGDTTTYTIHEDTLITNLVISDPHNSYFNQSTYYIRQ